jgi:uncharacterized RDD family membrane protein YckC
MAVIFILSSKAHIKYYGYISSLEVRRNTKILAIEFVFLFFEVAFFMAVAVFFVFFLLKVDFSTTISPPSSLSYLLYLFFFRSGGSVTLGLREL